MGNCITAPFRGNYQNRSGTHAAGRDATGGRARVGADGSTGGRDSVGAVGAGWGSGGAGERASVGAMRRRGQHEGGGKSPIGGSPRLQWATRRMAARGGRDAGSEARHV